MKRANMVQPGVLRLEEAPVPAPGPGQALVEVRVAGICGSDVHAFRGRHPFILCPVVPGHEFSGVVKEAGPGVERKLIGEAVTGLPSLVCGECHSCKHGRYNICEHLKVIGCQSDGAMAEFVAVPAEFLVPLPEGLGFDEGAMIEPVAVGVHAVRRVGSIGGARVMVLGSGTIGLVVTQVLKTYGACEVIVTDVNPRRLALARELGADYTVNPAEVDITQWAREKFGRDGIDLSFECVGIGPTVRQAIEVARKGTKVIIVGVFEEDVMVPMGLVQDREIELIGTLMYTRDDFVEAARLVAQRHVRVGPLVTHRFRLDEAQEAFETAAASTRGAIKVLVTVKAGE